jgi:hypothetical protein
MRSTRTVTVLGALGPALLLSLCLAARLFPRELDKLLRPYGLFVWLGILAGSVLLPTIAALRSSRWWFLVAAACLAIDTLLFYALMA